MNNQPIKRIPYGTADYRRMREENAYYVDKTHYIPLVEAAPYYLFCIRPRRFGKSLWLSVLQHYYDINLKDEFAALFAGTYIGANPTAARNSYLVMFFNFAQVNPDTRYVQESFAENGRAIVRDFLIRYERFFDEEERHTILSLATVDAQLREIFFHADRQRLKIYLLIDEYDNFANTILSREGQEAYRNLTHGSGFFRYFFNLLKGATGGQISGLARLYITGVSPVAMDDVSSGFNIGRNISLDSRFNEMIGFTETEVRTMLRYYQNAAALPIDIEGSMALMQEWYNHYRFGKASTTSMLNSDMVLHFMLDLVEHQKAPDELIDQNVRIDYGKLRHLMSVDRRLNGNFSQLQEIIESGEAVSDINASFPVERLLIKENFISLLYYFGLLSFGGERDGRPLLRIPDRTIKDLLYSYIRDGLNDVDVFRLDIWKLSNLLGNMAYRGEWQAVFDFLTEAIQKQSSVRDYLHGEKMIQGFLLAYLNVTHFFLFWSEKEMGGGFVDFYLEPFLARYPDMRYGYLIELKYIAQNEFTDEKLKKEIKSAEDQLRRYAGDARIQAMATQVPIKQLVLVYKGWELVYRAEWVESKP